VQFDPRIRARGEAESCADAARGRFWDGGLADRTSSGSLPGWLMKPAPFEYIRPASLAEACALLAADEDARLIAGGQTLVPMLAMRLARPARLIDILRLPELAGIREENGAIVVGATTRQASAEHDPVIKTSVPLLAQVLPWVGHPPTRNRGTIGGSIANADPSAEIPLVAVTLGAEILLATAHGKRSVPVDDFFVGAMLTTLGPGECVRAIRFPVWPDKRIGTGFFEISARRSDFAFVAAAAQVALDDEERCIDVALGIGGVGERPLRLDVSSLKSTKLDAASVSGAVHAASVELDAGSDLHASAAYRRRVAVTLGIRALEQARTDAQRAKSVASAR
jgi:CO/xanthine dehydrogenase FAD-binding subunit